MSASDCATNLIKTKFIINILKKKVSAIKASLCIERKIKGRIQFNVKGNRLL